MIITVTSDIWQTPAQSIVVPVNSVGKMGRGLAREAARRFPGCVGPYKDLCRSTLGFPGKAARISLEGHRPVLFGFTTKGHWMKQTRVGWIREGMPHLIEAVKKAHVPSCAIPALGCGLGGLSFLIVAGIIIAACEAEPEITWYMYCPEVAPTP